MRKYAQCTAEIFEGMLSAIRAGITMKQHVQDNKDNPDFPCIDTIRAYIAADNARIVSLARAREIGADAMTDDSVYIADTVLDTGKANNQIKSRQWLASKMKPKVYGDKIDIDLNQRIDVSVAVLQARRRAQVIEHQPLINITTSDIESDDNASVPETNPVVDPFS